MMVFFSSVYFDCVSGPLSLDPEEHQFKSDLCPVVGLDRAATSTAPSESELRSSFLDLADGVFAFLFREGVARVFFGGVGDHVWSDQRSG